MVRPSTRISPSVIDSEPGDGIEQRGLAAARRADEHEEATLLKFKVDALEDFHRAEALLETSDFEESHGSSFDGARHQSAYEIAAGEDIDEERGHGGDHRRCHVDVVFDDAG